jgi:hypothetical protein
VPPERANLVLAAHVPDGEVDVLVLDRLHVEACRRPRQGGIALLRERRREMERERWREREMERER